MGAMPEGAPLGRVEGVTPYQPRLLLTASPAAPASPGIRLPRRWLQILCAGCTFARSMDDPPRETGTISSTSKLIGSPACSE